MNRGCTRVECAVHMNLEVDMSRVNECMNLNVDPPETVPQQVHQDDSYSSQINFVVQALVEHRVNVPLPEYTRENISTIVRYLYHNPRSSDYF